VTACCSCAISVDINDVQRCVDKMKIKKAAGHDGIMAEHLKFGGQQLYVHVCLLFNSTIRLGTPMYQMLLGMVLLYHC